MSRLFVFKNWKTSGNILKYVGWKNRSVEIQVYGTVEGLVFIPLYYFRFRPSSKKGSWTHGLFVSWWTRLSLREEWIWLIFLRNLFRMFFLDLDWKGIFRKFLYLLYVFLILQNVCYVVYRLAYIYSYSIYRLCNMMYNTSNILLHNAITTQLFMTIFMEV